MRILNAVPITEEERAARAEGGMSALWALWASRDRDLFEDPAPPA